MKEATGELNTTVFVVISIGVLSTFFFTVLWPMLKNNFKQETGCKAAVCNCNDKSENGVVGRFKRDGIEYCTCTIKKDDGTEQQIECVYKG